MPDQSQPRLRDTTPAFFDFARASFLEDPKSRDTLWRERYRDVHPDVLAALEAEHGTLATSAVSRNLWHTRQTVEAATNTVPATIAELDPAVAELLDVDTAERPLHVLAVGTYATTATVARLDDDVAVIHWLEWYGDPEPARVLVAHETTHGWHELVLGKPPPADAAWLLFAEGLAIHASRALVPDRPEDEYFWYGVAGFEHWLDWCRSNREQLRTQLAEHLDDAETVEAFFGAGTVEGRWRTGFFVADEVVAALDRPLAELARWTPDEARTAVRTALES